jgi:RNA polymerase sigma-70 factor (ECF subfamily)
MNSAQMDQHLSQIATVWTALDQAHRGVPEAASAAQRQLLERYTPAIYRYLFSIVRNADAADELFQEFALRLVRGDFRRADPQRGRFRDFLKTALYHLIVDYRRRGSRPVQALGEFEPPVEDPSIKETDEDFAALCRQELMARTFRALAEEERATGQPLHTVLRFRMDHPEMHSPEMAEELGRRLGKSLSSVWVRKKLLAARTRFAALLLEEVARSLEAPTTDQLEQELLELGLLDYCRSALEARRQRGGPG